MIMFIYLYVSFGNALLRIVVSHLLQAIATQCLLVCFVQYIMDAFGQIRCIAEVGDIAILLMVNHFRNTTDTESYAWYTACHCFHDGVGQIL